MTAAGFEMFIKAIRAYCSSSCSREACGGGCPFWPWSECLRQVCIFTERRARIATARRTAARAV